MKKITTLIMAIILIGSLLSGLYSFANELVREGGYNVTIDNKYESSFNQTQQITAELNETYEDVQNMTANTGGSVGIITLIPEILIMSIGVIIIPFRVMMDTVMILGNDYLGIPSWAIGLAVAIIFLAILFAIIEYIRGYKT